jgi:AbrB family looped-hinge helix DNA binding protein
VQELVATITSKGQVTIPVQVRRHLKLNEHDAIAFVIAPDGTVTVQVPEYPTIESLRGVGVRSPSRSPGRKWSRSPGTTI